MGGMKILLANPRGFCAGVNMAIQCVEEALKIVALKNLGFEGNFIPNLLKSKQFLI